MELLCRDTALPCSACCVLVSFLFFSRLPTCVSCLVPAFLFVMSYHTAPPRGDYKILDSKRIKINTVLHLLHYERVYTTRKDSKWTPRLHSTHQAQEGRQRERERSRKERGLAASGGAGGGRGCDGRRWAWVPRGGLYTLPTTQQGLRLER